MFHGLFHFVAGVAGRCALAGLLLAAPQQPPKALSQQVLSSDYGISEWSAIRLGQVSVVHAAAGDELRVNQLLTKPRTVYSGPRRSATPGCDGNCLLVASFDTGTANRLGGYFNAFQGRQSTARVTLDKGDDGRRALTVDYDNRGGYCGAWVHLFDFTLPAAERVFLDSTPFSHLTFWIRGRRGGERILLKAADARWEAKEDALPVGELSLFLHGRTIDEKWQLVDVPLAAFEKRLNRRELATLVFEAVGTGAGLIAIKDIAFCKKAEPLLLLGPPLRAAVRARTPDRAMWVWNTADILGSSHEQQRLVNFAHDRGITDLFLQLTGANEGGQQHGEIRLEHAKWRPFVSLLNRSGLRAHALDGFGQYALPEWHDAVLRTVGNVIRYNQSVRPDEKFSGIHYDIEPYLIRGFAGPLRGKILASYLELLKKIVAETRPAGVPLGVDIPFWFDSRDEWTGKMPVVDFGGKSKLVSEHVIDLTDQVAVMDYRTYAFGADGALSLAKGELEYAAKTGKRVFVGLETTHLPDEDLVEFEGEPVRGVPEAASDKRVAVLAPEGDAATLWLVEPSQSKWLREVAEKRRPLLWWPVARVIHVPGDKLSFERLGPGALERTMAEAEEDLSGYSSFAGFAIHDYVGYRALLEHRQSP